MFVLPELTAPNDLADLQYEHFIFQNEMLIVWQAKILVQKETFINMQMF